MNKLDKKCNIINLHFHNLSQRDIFSFYCQMVNVKGYISPSEAYYSFKLNRSEKTHAKYVYGRRQHW